MADTAKPCSTVLIKPYDNGAFVYNNGPYTIVVKHPDGEETIINPGTEVFFKNPLDALVAFCR